MDYKEKVIAMLNSKELSQEQKEKLENIFPELTMSEDERIRKALIEMIHDTTGDECEDCYHVSKESVLAWLEKQGEKKSIFNADDWYVSEVDGKIHNAKFIFIEKQGEKKDFTFKSIPRLLEMVPPTDKAKSYCEKLRDSLQAEGYHTDSKIVGEHLKHMNGEAIAVATSDENVDKPESKFKVGDWFVNNNRKDVFLIKSINTNGYCALEDIKGNIISPCLPPCESDSHIWTIEDAKDGDVLVTTKTRNCPFIYRKTSYKNNLAYYYVGIDGDGDLARAYPKKMLHHFGPTSNVIPATKEQRDILFARIKKAGYEWDSEKKELKKIEPKTLNANKVVEWLDEHVPTKFEDMQNYVNQFKKDFEI